MPPIPHTCPWWFNWTFDNALRQRLQRPDRVLAPLVRAGQRVLDLGCGTGAFAIVALEMVGDGGELHAVDLQRESLDRVAARARKAGLEGRLRLHQGDVSRLDLTGPFDAAYAMWMVHEVPDKAGLCTGVAGLLAPDAPWLVAEPKIHVREATFDAFLADAVRCGFAVAERPPVPLSWAAVLRFEGEATPPSPQPA